MGRRQAVAERSREPPDPVAPAPSARAGTRRAAASELAAAGAPPPPAGEPQPEPKSKGRKKPGSEDPEAKSEAPRSTQEDAKDGASRRSTPASTAPDETESGADGPELKTYRVTLTPGPDVLRRGINPLGVLDELRDLGETSIVTDPDQVPPLDQLDPERCYLSWTITVKTDADPERLGEAFLFFAEDSTAAIQRLGPDGKWLPVRLGEAAAAAVGGAADRNGKKPAPAGRRVDRGHTSRPRCGRRPTARLRLTRGLAVSTSSQVPLPDCRHGRPGAAEAARPDTGRCHAT